MIYGIIDPLRRSVCHHVYEFCLHNQISNALVREKYMCLWTIKTISMYKVKTRTYHKGNIYWWSLRLSLFLTPYMSELKICARFMATLRIPILSLAPLTNRSKYHLTCCRPTFISASYQISFISYPLCAHLFLVVNAVYFFRSRFVLFNCYFCRLLLPQPFRQ